MSVCLSVIKYSNAPLLTELLVWSQNTVIFRWTWSECKSFLWLWADVWASPGASNISNKNLPVYYICTFYSYQTDSSRTCCPGNESFVIFIGNILQWALFNTANALILQHVFKMLFYNVFILSIYLIFHFTATVDGCIYTLFNHVNRTNVIWFIQAALTLCSRCDDTSVV